MVAVVYQVHINSSKLSIEGKLQEKVGGSFELGFAI